MCTCLCINLYSNFELTVDLKDENSSKKKYDTNKHLLYANLPESTYKVFKSFFGPFARTISCS